MRAGRITPFVAALAVLATMTTPAATAAGQEPAPPAPAPRADGPPEGAVLFLPQVPDAPLVSFWDGRRAEIESPQVQQPLVGQLDGDRFEDVFGYTPGHRLSSWFFGGAESTPDGPVLDLALLESGVSGRHIPLVGDFGGPTGPGGRSIDDILWYVPGPTPDTLWILPPEGIASKRTVRIDGYYRPFVLEGDGTEPEAIVWYAPGPAGDSIWDFRDVPTGAHRTRSVRIDGDYRPTSFATDDARLIHWFDRDGHDSTWRLEGTEPGDMRFRTLPTPQVDGGLRPIALDRGATAGVFFYGPGQTQDLVVATTDAAGTAMTSTPTYQVWGSYVHVVAGDVTSATPGQRDGVDELIFGGLTRATMWRMPTLGTRVETTFTGLPRVNLPVVVATELPPA